MSEARTKARALLAAATPGPFSVYPLARAGRGFGVGRETPSGHDEGICEDPHMLAEDAELFAAAPTLIATLCDEADALRAELEKESARRAELTAKVRRLEGRKAKTCIHCGATGERQPSIVSTIRFPPGTVCDECQGLGAIIVEGEG